MNLAAENEVLGKNLPRRHFVNHNIPHDDPVSNPGLQRWEASDLPLELWRGQLRKLRSNFVITFSFVFIFGNVSYVLSLFFQFG
jgi:hypothetical protein